MLYICATPIGNLNDITLRALEILNKADIILCEDTRMSQRLLQHHGINSKHLVALHDHNENEAGQKVIEWLKQGMCIVQISDAGTPGISDPGARLCNLAFEHGFTPIPLPGACAYASLLSVAGLVDINCLFSGFLSNKSTQRQKQMAKWISVDFAVCIYESPHRIIECLNDIITILGEDRLIIMGRELTKQFETIQKLQAKELLKFVSADSNQQRGEFALIIMPEKIKNDNENENLTQDQINILTLIAKELPTKKAVNLTHKLTGGNKEIMYNYLVDSKMRNQ